MRGKVTQNYVLIRLHIEKEVEKKTQSLAGLNNICVSNLTFSIFSILIKYYTCFT